MRKKEILRIANMTIKATENLERVIYENGDTENIISVIMMADAKSAEFTADLAPRLKGRSDYQTVRVLWNLVKRNIRYQKDQPGYEVIKSPAKLWADKSGDCKSYSVFIGSVLQNLGIPYFYRFAHYPDSIFSTMKDVNHVYPVALINGRQVPLDAVADNFDYEEPADYYFDKIPAHQSGISGINRRSKSTLIAAGLTAIFLGASYLLNSNQVNNNECQK